MRDLSSFSLGVLLWLGFCGLLVTLFNDTSSSGKKITKSDSLLTDSLFNSQEKMAEVEDLKRQLAIKISELAFTTEKNLALEEELQITSDRLESNEDKYIQCQQNFHHQVEELEDKIKNLEDKCRDLTEKLENLPSELINNWQQESFNLLQTLLANYPTAKSMIKLKPDLLAKSVINLLKPLDKLLAKWGIESIGKPWEKVTFNPQIHYSDEENLTPNELVYIRFIGYRQGDNILLQAKVSRTLPKKRV
jgi:molecular chaperone GrpE (heat shock protein)